MTRKKSSDRERLGLGRDPQQLSLPLISCVSAWPGARSLTSLSLSFSPARWQKSLLPSLTSDGCYEVEKRGCLGPSENYKHKALVLKMITQMHSERLKDTWKVDLGAFSIMASEIVKVKSGNKWSILLEVSIPRRLSDFCGCPTCFLTSYVQLEKHQ